MKPWRWIPLAFLAVFFAYPLLKALGGGTSIEAWTWLFTHAYPQNRLAGAALQATASVALTLLLAIPLAWLYHQRRIRFGRLHMALHAAPFVLPVFVVVFGMQELFGPLGVLDRLGPYGAVILAHAYYNYGFAARLIHAALERRPHRLEAAARVLGASPVQAFLRTTVPLLAPALLATALLVWLFSFSSFGVVLLMGQGRVGTLETLLYENLRGAFPRYDRAAALGIAQLGINALLFLAYFALQRRTANIPRDPDARPAPAAWRHHAIAASALAAGLLPAALVLRGSFRVAGQWTLEAWRALGDPDHPFTASGFQLGHAVERTLLYAASSAALAITLTVLLAYGIRQSGRVRRLAEAAAALPLGTSSVLIGFGYLIGFGAGSWLDLRGSIVAIVLAHTLVSFPFASRALIPALESHDARLDEAARILGAPPAHVVTRIHWPLLKGPLLAAGALAAAMSLGDFGASLILMNRDTMSLSIWIEAHQGVAFRTGPQAVARALTVILMALSTAVFLIADRAQGKEAWR